MPASANDYTGAVHLYYSTILLLLHFIVQMGSALYPHLIICLYVYESSGCSNVLH